MNHTIKGIIIVAAITSMLVVGINMIPLGYVDNNIDTPAV
jgi:hypothetical protein